MAYKVITQSRAERDIEEAFLYIAEQAPEAAARWYARVKAKIQSLKDKPARYSLAAEADLLGIEVRQALVGKRTGTYRVVFRIDEEKQLCPCSCGGALR